jgi:hypothetical protein
LNRQSEKYRYKSKKRYGGVRWDVLQII